MGCYWEITTSIKPLPGKEHELLSILEEYNFDVDDNLDNDSAPSVDASFYDYGSYGRVDDLCTELEPLVESGTMHAKCDEDEDDGVVIVFKNGTSEEVSSQSFVFYEGLDDPWVFAQSLPDSVKQAILAHADEIKSAQ